ncbi:hydrogenase 3 maturation endopeptidase HyCI [Methanocella arvoryzae]|uniref:Coenzyme F420-reducing hydrogenase, delta subunit (Maturation peptidase) n=1 Tax=Methanocella arvoryzae (strain DSM 22066 / NBRC 105507 / MRE50) TaxID=351160 RepID=Q0W6M7_METAR|nr:hydrogenase 3 maturation endopeptidase HyCI [Methanocella arvoryzae]CAJ35966.1 coenzyme F420-reducing hydrogenase, delta subunit (maturation peptidase) [Methanocella arvoryzae MRE50]
MAEDLVEALKARLKGIPADRIVFVGVGNRFRGDDAAGPLVIDLLAEKVPHAIDAGSAPENITGAIKKLKPKAIVIIDALIFKDAPPGSAFIVESEEIAQRGFSHTLSLDFVMDYLREDTGADVFLIGVQPGYLGDTEGLSPGMREALEKIATTILDAIA